MSTRQALPLTIATLIPLAFVGIVWKPVAGTTANGFEEFSYSPPRGYVCYRAPGPFVIDGKLEDAWAAIPWSDDFVDIEGDAKPKPQFRTRMKMAWDDHALYIAADLEEPHVRAVMTKHDSYIFHEDHDFEVFLDPDGDNHLYAELEMNARNTTWDLLLVKPYRDGGAAIDAWEISGLKTAVHVDGTLNDARDADRRWTIEIAWPWEGLKQLTKRPVPPRPGDQWRINFSRVELDYVVDNAGYRRASKWEENWVWSPQGVVDMHRPERWGYLQYCDKTPGAEAFQPDPTGPARMILHSVYDAQHTHRKSHGHFASSLTQLGLKAIRHETVDGYPQIEVMSNGFEARVRLKSGQVVRIHDDSRTIVP